MIFQVNLLQWSSSEAKRSSWALAVNTKVIQNMQSGKLVTGQRFSKLSSYQGSFKLNGSR
jgi:hypothetical protein